MATIAELDDIWIFGYGSLIWRPNFKFQEKVVGYVRGYDRRFWQGSTYHRGNSEKPGRVVTLVPNEEGKVWGVAYHVCGKEQLEGALRHLTTREQKLGCYDVEFFNFVPRDINQKTIKVLLYFAKPGNDCYLGAATDLDISKEILTSSGSSGYNVEYLFRLAEFMREFVPEEDEQHLFNVDRLARKKLGLSTKETTPWLSLASYPQFLNVLESFCCERLEDISADDHIPVEVKS